MNNKKPFCANQNDNIKNFAIVMVMSAVMFCCCCCVPILITMFPPSPRPEPQWNVSMAEVRGATCPSTSAVVRELTVYISFFLDLSYFQLFSK